MIFTSAQVVHSEFMTSKYFSCSGAGQDPVAALLYCTPSIGSVDLSVIDGHIIVKDGHLLTVDVQVRHAIQIQRLH